MNKVVGSVLAAAAGLCTLAIPAHAGSLEWSGNVDDTATIYISRQDVRVDSNAKGVHGVRRNLDGFLPRRDTRVWLNDERGRGDIQIVQQPNADNNYTAAVRIRDRQAGSARYHFVLQWRDDRDRDRDRDGNWGRGDGDHGWHHDN